MSKIVRQPATRLLLHRSNHTAVPRYPLQGIAVSSPTSQQKESITLRYIGTGQWQNDLELRLGEYRYVANTFYFAIEDIFKPERDLKSERDVGKRLAHLLDQWLELIDALEPHAKAYLPFDISDLCSGWLEVTRAEDKEVTVKVGWSMRIQGGEIHVHDIRPTAKQELALEMIPDVRVQITVDELRNAIQRDRRAFTEI